MESINVVMSQMILVRSVTRLHGIRLKKPKLTMFNACRTNKMIAMKKPTIEKKRYADLLADMSVGMFP